MTEHEAMRVFYPLRSNVGWFQDADLQAALLTKIKTGILAYDELILEDGTYQGDVTERGGSSFWIPPGMLEESLRRVELKRDIAPGNVTLSIGPDGASEPTGTVYSAPSVSRFKIDYFEFLQQINHDRTEFIKLVTVGDHSFSPEIRRGLTDWTSADEQAFRKLIPNDFLRSHLLKDLNRDLFVATTVLNAATVVDDDRETILRAKATVRVGSEVEKAQLHELATQQAIEIAAPNFSELTLDDVIELRYDKSWVEFREYVGRLTAEIRQAPSLLAGDRSLREVTSKHVSRSFYDARKQRHETGGKLAIDVAMGVLSNVPGAGIPLTIGSVFNGVDKFFSDKRSWFAFLVKVEEKAEARQRGEGI